MSKFVIYRREIEKAINECLRAASEYRKSNNANEVPHQTIQDLVNLHITPLGGKENKLEIPLPEGGKQDWRRNATELVFRRTLLHIVGYEETEERYKQIFDCLDVVLYCSQSDVDLVENIVPLTLLEELVEVHTTTGCETIFNYVEKRKSQFTVDMVPGKGKGLILLRMCNELLRRLSKETSTVFCGRILMFLANSFPLGERSGVNLRGDFNTDTIHYDDDQEVDADTTLTEEQKSFYKLFWSTRKYFSNPPSIFAEDNFNKLQEGTNKIVERFKVIEEKETELLGARNKEIAGMKRRRDNEISDLTQMHEDPSEAEEMLATINRVYQFPRLLSSRNLLELEMEDARFRRNVIVQYLILFQYLSSFSETEKEKTKQILAARGTTKQSLIQPTYTLSDEQIEWINETRTVLVALLRAIKPHGNLYTDIILSILEHESHWIIWKASGCPSFEKTPVDTKALENGWLRKKPRLEAPPAKYRYTHGNQELSKLFSKSNESLSEFMLKRPKLPSAVEVIDSALGELDDSLAPAQERFKYANGALLHASRLVYQSHPSVVRKAYTAKKEIYKELRDKLNEETAEEDEKPDFIVGEEKTEDHVHAEIDVLKKARDILIEETKQVDEMKVD